MRTDLPLHSKSPNRARHLKEIEIRRIQRANIANALTKVIITNLARKEMMKLYFLIKGGYNIIFDETKCRKMSLYWPERDLPPELIELLSVEYRPKEQKEESDL